MSIDTSNIESKLLKVIIDEIKNSISKKSCPVHNKKAKLVVTGDNLDNLKISASGCCNEFVSVVAKEIEIKIQ